jgi:hypothetical protein
MFLSTKHEFSFISLKNLKECVESTNLGAEAQIDYLFNDNYFFDLLYLQSTFLDLLKLWKTWLGHGTIHSSEPTFVISFEEETFNKPYKVQY